MGRPPEGVVFIARTHWTVGAVVLVSTVLLHWVMDRVPRIEFGLRTYLIAGGVGTLYLLAGTLVWLGVRWIGPVLSRVCTLLYLPRPGMGLRVWDAMNTPEFRAHFEPRRRRPDAPPAAQP